MNINLNLLGDFGKSIKEYSYDNFYSSCVKMVENIAFSKDKNKDLYLKIYQSYQKGEYKYMDMFVLACLKCQVDMIINKIKKKGFDKKGASIYTLKCIGDKARDMDTYIIDENGIMGSVGMFLNNISFEEISKVIYDVVGFEYTSQEDLIRSIHSSDMTSRERVYSLCKVSKKAKKIFED